MRRLLDQIFIRLINLLYNFVLYIPRMFWPFGTRSRSSSLSQTDETRRLETDGRRRGTSWREGKLNLRRSTSTLYLDQMNSHLTEQTTDNNRTMTTSQTSPPDSDTRINDDTPVTMDIAQDTHTTLSTAYNKNKNARRTQKDTHTHDIDNCTTTTTTPPTSGSFDTNLGIHKCFLASRTDIPTNTHQNIACSFDPHTNICITCDSQHTAIGTRNTTPIVLAVTDQHFPSSLPASGGRCVRVVRIEDGHLPELTDLVFELTEKTSIPEHSVILLSSGTDIIQHGSSGYVWDWVRCASRLQKAFPTVTVCPTPPIWSADTPGSTYRSTLEVNTVLGALYGNRVGYPGTVWDKVIEEMRGGGEFALPRGHVETYVLPFPTSLSDCTTFKNHIFVSRTPSPAKVFELSRKATEEVLYSLLTCLNGSLSAGLDPVDISERVKGPMRVSNVEEIPPPLSFVTVGASHMRAISSHLEAKGYQVCSLAVSGWTASAKNLSEVGERVAIECAKSASTVVVLDLWSNSVTRYTQADDSTALAIKQNGRWHMPGEVKHSSNTELDAMLEKAVPVLKKIANKKIIVPPLPRYAFGGCCEDESHAPNTRDSDHPLHTLQEHLRIRSHIKKAVLTHKIENTRVLDAIGSFTPDHLTPSQKLTHLKTMTHSDNVHYTQTAYDRLTDKVLSEVNDSATRSLAKPAHVAKAVRWRGFVTTPGFGSVSTPGAPGAMGPPPQPSAAGQHWRQASIGGRGGDGAPTAAQGSGTAYGRQYHPYRRN